MPPLNGRLVKWSTRLPFTEQARVRTSYRLSEMLLRRLTLKNNVHSLYWIVDVWYKMLSQFKGKTVDLSIKFNFKMTTKQKGNLTELQCIASFIEQGCGVSIPYGDNSKYDFIADFNGQLLRIQVKTSSSNDNGDTIKFSCRSTHVNCNGVKNIRYDKNEIDYFATYWNNKCYIVPVGECSTQKTLRFVETQHRNQNPVNMAVDYEIENQLHKIVEMEVSG